MFYFDYQCGNMGMIWNLFSGLSEMTDEEKLGTAKNGCSFSHTLEIVSAALNKANSDIMTEDFDLRAYESKCRENDKVVAFNSASKVLFIVDEDSSSDEESVGYGDISNRKLKKKEEAFDMLLSSYDFEKSINELFNIRNKYIKEKSIDVVQALVSSLKGIPEAIDVIKKLSDSDNVFKELIADLCSMESGMLLAKLEMSF